MKKLSELKNLTYEEKIFYLRELVKNDIETWKALSEKLDFNIVYIMQPCMGWTKKKLTAEEEFVFENQRLHIGIGTYCFDQITKRSNYLSHKNFLSEICKNNNIKFIDMNDEIEKIENKESFFYDFCHLTDFGNKTVAKILLDL